MPKVVPRSGADDPAAAATAETMVEIIVHIEGTTIPITLSLSDCTSTSWGEFCKIVVEKYLPKVDPSLLLKILTKISPSKRLSHYKARVGDGYAIIIQLNWSPADIPGFARLPFEPSYTEVNMAIVPTEEGALQLMAKPHLPILQLAEGESLPTSLDVNLVIMAVSSTHPPLPSTVSRTSVLTLDEHLSFPGCVDKFSVEAANGENDILPDISLYSGSATAPAVAAATAAGKRKASPKEPTASTNKKAKSAEKTQEGDDDDGAKKPAAKKGGAAASAAKRKSAPKKPAAAAAAAPAAAAAAKKSPPEESAAAESKTPSKKAGMDMIRKYEAAKAKQLNESSSSSKTDSPSIPKVISAKKTTKITPKKGKATTATAKDDSAAKKPSASIEGTEAAGRDRAPSVDKGNEMLRVYEEAKLAKENVATGNEKKAPSKKSKESGDSTKSSSSKKTTRGSSKKAKGDEEKSAKKPPAAAKEDSGEDDKAAPSVDNGKKMVSVWLATQEKEKEAGSKKTEDSTKPSSGKKAKGSSKSDKEESSAKKSSAPEEEGKSAKKKAKTAAASEATKASKKKRKASSTDDKTADAPKSPSRKKVKTSKADEKSTPAKDDGKKSAAATKKADSEVKKRGPKRKDYDDIPSEPAADFPEGWTSKNIPRSTGDKYDQRWYSPGGMTFNTKKGATIFKNFVEDGNDEATAYKLFKKAEKEAKEERKAQREAEAMKKKKMEVVESEVF